MIMSKETLAKTIREIPDFPIPGILFYDVTTLFKNPSALQELSDTLYEMYKDKGITKVVGIESRGFIMGPILATRLGAGFVPMRKPGKLPAETIEESYDKEYGKDTVQIHKDAIEPDDVKGICKLHYRIERVAWKGDIQQRCRCRIGIDTLKKQPGGKAITSLHENVSPHALGSVLLYHLFLYYLFLTIWTN